MNKTINQCKLDSRTNMTCYILFTAELNSNTESMTLVQYVQQFACTHVGAALTDLPPVSRA